MKEATEEELIQLDRQIRGETLVKGFDIEFWTGLVIATSETNDGHSAYKILENKIQEKKFVKKIEMLENILKQEKYFKLSKKFPSICNKLKTIKDERNKFAHSRPFIPITSGIPSYRKKNEVWITYFDNGTQKEVIKKTEHEKKMKKWELVKNDLLYILTEVQEKNDHFNNAA